MGAFEDWLDRVTVDELGESYAKKKKRKKLNIPGPGDYAYYTTGVQPEGVPLWPEKPTIPKDALPSIVTPMGAQLAQAQMPVTPTVDMTMEEMATRNINLAHFKYTQQLANPKLVASLLENPATASLSYDEYLRLFKGAERFDKDYEFKEARKRILDPETHPTLQNLHETVHVTYFDNEVQVLDREQRTHPMFKTGQVKEGDPAVIFEVGQTPVEKVKRDMRTIMRMTKEGDPESLTKTPNDELLALSGELANRLRRRGAPVEWDVHNPYGDPEFLRAASLHGMGPAWAYSVYGKGDDAKNARAVFEYMRTLPFSTNAWDEIGKKLGVGVADWHNSATFENVLDAMRTTDDDTVKGLIFDAWMFGRKVGVSPSHSRAMYATEFGADRLPTKERQAYDEDVVTLPKIVDKIMGAPFRFIDDVATSPVLAPITAPIGWAGNELAKQLTGHEVAGTGEFLMMPFLALGDSLASLYDLSLQANPALFDQGIKSQQEYVRLVQAGLVEKAGFWDAFKLWEYHWGVFLDGSRTNEAWENNWGRDPLTVAAETISAEQLGYVAPWATETGQTAWLGANIYLGAKMDPFVRTAVTETGRAAFEVGRGAEQRLMARRAGATGEGHPLARITQMRQDLASEAGTLYWGVKDYPDSVRASQKIQARAAKAAEEGRAWDWDAESAAVRAELYAEDAAQAAKLKGTAQKAEKLPEPQRLADEGAPILYNDGTFIVGDQVHYTDWVTERGTRDPRLASEILKRETPMALLHEDVLELLGVVHDPGFIRARVVRMEGVEPSLWMTSPSGAHAAPEVEMQLIVDMRDAGLVKDSFTVNMPEGRTVGEVVAYAEREMGIRPSKPEWMTSKNYVETTKALQDAAEKVGADVLFARKKGQPGDTFEKSYKTEKGAIDAADRMAFGVEHTEVYHVYRDGDSFTVTNVKRPGNDLNRVHSTPYVGEGKGVGVAHAEPVGTAGAGTAAPALTPEQVARVEPHQVSGISAGYKVRHPETGEYKYFKTSLGAEHYAERVNTKLHGTKWPDYQTAREQRLADEAKPVEAHEPASNPEAADLGLTEVQAREQQMDVAPEVPAPAVGDEVVFSGKPHTIKSILDLKGKGEPKYLLVNEKGKEVWTNRAAIKSENARFAEPITPEEQAFLDATATPKQRAAELKNAPIGNEEFSVGERVIISNSRWAAQRKGTTGSFSYGTVVKKTPSGKYTVDIDGVGKRSLHLYDNENRIAQPEAAAPVTKNEQGVEVSEIEVEGAPVEVDAAAAPWVQTLNDNGFPTYGSHGGGKGHPAGHPAKGVEPYVEFRLVDFGKERKGRMGAIARAAKKAGMRVDKTSKTAEGRTLLTISGENMQAFIDALVPPKPKPAFKAPRTLREWADQLEEATAGELSRPEVENLAILIATDARYMGELPDTFVAQRLAGVVEGNRAVFVDGVLADAVSDGGALFAKAKASAKGNAGKLPAAVEFYREQARQYLETKYPEMADDIAAAVDYLTKLNRETTKAVSKGTGKALRWNTKTLFSIDISTICPFAERPCAMCYNYQLEGLMRAKKAGKLETGAPQSPAKQFDATPYNGEILEMPESLVTYLNETQGGLRVNSFGDWTPQVDAVFQEIVAHAEARGLTLKVITKQQGFIEKYGVLKGEKSTSPVTIQLSTDFDGGWTRTAMELKGTLTREQKNVLALLENKGGARQMLSTTLSLDDAAKIKAKYQNVVIRYTAVNRAEAMLAATDPRISVLTLYHLPITDPVKLRVALEEMWRPPRGEGYVDYPVAGKRIDGLEVGTRVDNMSSIGASLENWEALPGIREVPMSEFAPYQKNYAKDYNDRSHALVAEIKESGRIDPLIVVIDKDGAYVLEGGHRLDALQLMGAKSLPAKVVLDLDSIKQKVGNFKEIVDYLGEKNLQAFADNMKPFTPKQFLGEAMSGRPAKMARVQAELDAVYGKGKITVEEWAEKAYNKVCCQSGKCGTCPIQCSFGIRAIENADLLLAAMDGVPIASVQFLADGRALVRALKSPGVLEMTHEVGHIFRRTLNAKDSQLAREWAGLRKNEPWTVAAEERFAEAFGEYFKEYVEKGTLPTREYVPLMRRFTQWLADLWNTMRGKPLARKATPEIRDLFDRFAEMVRETEELPKLKEQLSGPPAKAIAGQAQVPVPPHMEPMYVAMFRNNREVMAKVDDPSWIAQTYDIPTDGNPVLKDIVRKIAATKEPKAVERLLFKLEANGIEIDGGAAAMIKNLRQRTYRKGMTQRNWLRFFTTPTLYGKTQHINQATESAYSYMVASKLGLEKMTPESWAWLREQRRRLWEEDNPNKKQAIVREICEAIDDNIIAREGSLTGLNNYTKLYHRMQGKSIMSGGKVAYFGKIGKNGEPVEASFVTSAGKARATAAKELERAKAELDDLIESPATKTIEAMESDIEVGGETAAHAKRLTKKEKNRLQEALDEAEQEVYRVADAIDVVESLGDLKWEDLSKVQLKALNEAHQVLDKYTVPVPVKLAQRRTHIEFNHNPRILASYMAGKTSRALALTDQLVMQPLMTIFKETVMASLGFPIRVNIGDEFIRLIPEGTVNRLRGRMLTRKPLEKLAKDVGVDMTEFNSLLHDKLAYDWVASDSGSWILVTKQTHPKYYEYLAIDLKTWAEEPIVQRLVERNGGVFPKKPGDIKAFIEELMAEKTELSAEIREFLEDTYRYGSKGVDKLGFDEWCGLWQDRMEAIAAHDTLRQAMTAKNMDIEALKRVPDEYLWPVNAPEQAFIGANTNPLVQLSRLNPFHYIYNGVRVPFTDARRVGSLQLLGAMSNWVRETVFSDRYYLERNAELARAPHLAKTPEGLAELHNVAAEKAMRYTNKVTYSRSSTMFEDMTRNLIPFGNAYRQFWVYWASAFAKHPLAITAYTQFYRQVMEDLGAEGQFLHWGDYQIFMPGVPFFAATDAEAGEGVGGLIKSNLPQASFLFTAPSRTLMGAMGVDAEERSELPMLAGLSTNMAPFSRQGRLLYGVTGVSGWGGSDFLSSLLGDPDKLHKASINALLGQLRYKEGELYRDKPWWWAPLDLLGKHPEALFAETMKQMPNPATVTYSPQETYKKNDLLYKYYDATGKGNATAAAKLREENPWLDRYLSFYDASEEEKVAMKLDPKNKDLLKFWVSPYNYDTSGRPYDGYDWQTQFAQGRISWKEESDLEKAIHNLYVDVHGGTYVQTEYRQEGVQYAGDAPRAQARKRTIAKINRAMNWAQRMAKRMSKTQGWDYDTLMFQFENPDKNWGVWPQLIKSSNLNPVDYNIYAIANVFFDKYADEAYPESKGAMAAVKESEYGKIKPKELSSEDALRALDMAKWVPDPELQKKFLTETPYVNQLRQTKREQRDEIFKAVVAAAADEQWYWLGSQQFKTVGIPASPKLDMIQLQLNAEYNAAKKLKSGSSEYKAAMVAYWAHRDQVLKTVKGGALIAGGVADRLIAIPFVLTPKVTSMGTGKTAVAKQESYEAFMRTVKRELAKDAPSTETVDEAWQKVDWNAYSEKQRNELMRVAAWSFLLAEAKWRRNDMRTTYSDYYDARGNSAASTYGQQHVKALNTTVEQLRRFSPAFARELESWFDSDTNFGYRFLDWYTY